MQWEIKEMYRLVQPLVDQGQTVEITMDVLTAIAVISNLQLALRHPNNNREPAKTTRKLVKRLIGSLDVLAPGLGAILRLGDNPPADGAAG